MFIEVTSNHEKMLINTDLIMTISSVDYVDSESAMITFVNPLTLRGSNKLALDETYAEVMDMLVNTK